MSKAERAVTLFFVKVINVVPCVLLLLSLVLLALLP